MERTFFPYPIHNVILNFKKKEIRRNDRINTGFIQHQLQQLWRVLTMIFNIIIFFYNFFEFSRGGGGHQRISLRQNLRFFSWTDLG